MYNDDTQNYPLCRLKLVVETNQNSLNSPKLLSQRIRKHYYKTLGNSVINSTLSPISGCNHILSQNSNKATEVTKSG